MNANDAQRTLVAFAIEKALLQSGESNYKAVESGLETDYNCKLIDCFDKPEYLKITLQKVYGNSHCDIVAIIEMELGDHALKDPYFKFLESIKC